MKTTLTIPSDKIFLFDKLLKSYNGRHLFNPVHHNNNKTFVGVDFDHVEIEKVIEWQLNWKRLNTNIKETNKGNSFFKHAIKKFFFLKKQ